jgi:hypothetical protein
MRLSSALPPSSGMARVMTVAPAATAAKIIAMRRLFSKMANRKSSITALRSRN